MATTFEGLRLSIAVGIVIGVFASFVQSLGLTIQRKSHVQNQSLPEEQQKVEHRRPLWLLGFAIFISSNIFGSLFQIASLPVVILAPLGAVSLLWNALFARIILGDVFSKWMAIGTILIAGGAVLIAIFGIVPEPTRSIEDLLILFSRPTFIVYFSLLGFVLVVCLLITHIVEWSFARRLPTPPPSPHHESMLIPPTANPITTTAQVITEQTPLLDRKPLASRASSISLRSLTRMPSSRVPLFLAISYASASGLLSGMCLLFAKSGVELLLLTLGGHNQFWRWQTWCLLIGLGVFALLQLWYLHKALILADPTVVCPLAFCFYNLSSIVNGLVYFDQFAMIPWQHLLLVGVGIIVLLGGVWVVSINNGGGGVNLGAWQVEDDSSDSDSDHDVEIGYRSSSPGQSREGLRLTPVPMERSTVSDSQAVNSDTYFSGMTPSSASSPIREWQTTDHLGRPSSRSHHDGRISVHRRRPTIDLSPGSPPLPATGTLVGTGFSIGLSPVSPGFVLVPRERRGRRVSGMASESQERAPLMRRTVSDGEVESLPAAMNDATGIAGHAVGSESPAAEVPRIKGKWGWVRNVFSRGQS